MEDPNPTGPPATWRTYRACLEQAPDTGHLVVIQDDVLPCCDFEDAVTAAVAECPCRVLCLFVSKQARWTQPGIYDAARAGERFARIHDRELFVPTVAIAWPVDAARAVAKWADGRNWGIRAQRADDAIIKDACVGLGLEVWLTIPSLVEHPGDVQSLIDPRGAGTNSRRALLAHSSLA